MTEADRPRGFFVTATDTEVGKTVVSAGLAMTLRERGLNVGVMKPVASGGEEGGRGLFSQDALFLKTAAGVDDDLSLINPVCLRPPLAPTVAAALEGTTVRLGAVTDAYRTLAERHEAMVVEGIGGLRVPVTEEADVADVAGMMGLPLIIVARPGLGTISHCVLTVDAARAEGLTVAGIVISRYPRAPDLAERTNPVEIGRATGAAILGLLPEEPTISVEQNRLGRLLELFREHVAVPEIS